MNLPWELFFFTLKFHQKTKKKTSFYKQGMKSNFKFEAINLIVSTQSYSHIIFWHKKKKKNRNGLFENGCTNILQIVQLTFKSNICFQQKIITSELWVYCTYENLKEASWWKGSTYELWGTEMYIPSCPLNLYYTELTKFS